MRWNGLLTWRIKMSYAGTFCKTCRSAAVIWRKDASGGWRLYDPQWMHPLRKTLKPHGCPPAKLVAPAEPDEFTDCAIDKFGEQP